MRQQRAVTRNKRKHLSMWTNWHLQRFRPLIDQVKLAKMSILLSHSMRDRPFQECFHYTVKMPSELHTILPSHLWSKLPRGRREGQKAGGWRAWDLKSATVPGICYCLVEMQLIFCHDKAASSHRAAQGRGGRGQNKTYWGDPKLTVAKRGIFFSIQGINSFSQQSETC